MAFGNLRAKAQSIIPESFRKSAEARKVYRDELRSARIREAKIRANQQAVLERKQRIARFARRPQTIGGALGLTRSLGARARGGAGRTLGIHGRKKLRKGQFGFKKIKKKRKKRRSYGGGYDNGYDSGFGGFGF